MGQTRTVNTQLLLEFDDVLRFTWYAEPTVSDTEAAFEVIHAHLDSVKEKVHVIVDIRSSPRFPLATTLQGAMKAQGHRNMGNWLVLGANRTARFIGSTITAVGKNNIVWCEDELDAHAQIELMRRNEHNGS